MGSVLSGQARSPVEGRAAPAAILTQPSHQRSLAQSRRAPRRVEGATLAELARSDDVSTSTISRLVSWVRRNLARDSDIAAKILALRRGRHCSSLRHVPIPKPEMDRAEPGIRGIWGKRNTQHGRTKDPLTNSPASASGA